MGRSLQNLEILAVDCQTTGANPDKGHLLEVGWGVGCSYGPSGRVESHLVRLPEGGELPRAISRLTGIERADLKQAIPRLEVWGRLLEAGRQVELINGRIPLVAHFARFEKSFLDHLRLECEPDLAPPFRFICTHEIARRLLPDIPRRGIRPLSGYFGHSLPECKRARSHVNATVLVWRFLVDLLARNRGIETVDDLLGFLRERPPARGSRWDYPLSREKRLAISEKPGVYRFKGGDGRVLYVGKASCLNKRVNSYYRKRRAADKILELVSQVRDVEVTPTPTALEAAVMEAEEIRLLDPPYNHALRDRGQSVWFFSTDLSRSGGEADRGHSIGPVLHREGLAGVRLLHTLLSFPLRPIADESVLARDLGLDRDRLEPGKIAEGLAVLAEGHQEARPPAMPASLLALGSRIRRERLAEEQVSPKEPTEPTEPDEPDQSLQPLEAEDVARSLESFLSGAARSSRLARWLILLSDAVLVWEVNGNGGATGRRYLTIEQGVTVGSGDAGIRGERDAAPGPRSSDATSLTRRRRLDRPAYDRLRVLNTEIRRLVTNGRSVSITLGLSGRRLEKGDLAALMRMV